MTKISRRKFIQASAAPLLLKDAVARLQGTKPVEKDSAFVRTDEGGKRWTVGNSLVEREIRFDPEAGLYTQSWRHLVTGRDFLQQSPNPRLGAEFSFQADTATLAGARQGSSADFDWVGALQHEADPGGKILEIKLRARKQSLEVSAFYAVYAGHPVVRKWISITNRGETRLTVSHLVFEAVNLQAAPPSVQILSAYYGVQPREIFFTGRAEDAAILVMDPRTHEGFMVMNEAPGWMKRTEMTNWGEGIQVMYDTDLFPFQRSVEPGRTLTSARSGVAFFVEDTAIADPHWVMPSYTAHVLMRKGSAHHPPWIYNTWEPFFENVDEKLMRELIPPASQLGIDIFTIDAGWSENLGDNETNPQKFPQGLSGLRGSLEAGGMRLGLWEPLAVMGPHSAVVREHPEWIIRDAAGKEKSASFPGPNHRVMCLDSPYRDWAAKRIIDLIRQYSLRYVKLDLTTVFNAYGEAPGCYAPNHYHHTWAESLGGIYEGIRDVTEQVYREHPDVLLDLTFELWGQKHIIDYGLLAAGDLDWMSNVDDESAASAGPRQARTLLYHRAMAIPAESMLIGNLRITTPSLEERFATAIGSAPLLMGDLRKLTPGQMTWLRGMIGWFKEFRRAVPIEEGFFPLGGWLQPECTKWDGFARLSRRGEGLIALFKNQSNLGQLLVRLPAFPEGNFHLRSVMSGQTLESVTGSRFREGVPVRLPQNYDVEIIEVSLEPFKNEIHSTP